MTQFSLQSLSLILDILNNLHQKHTVKKDTKTKIAS